MIVYCEIYPISFLTYCFLCFFGFVGDQRVATSLNCSLAEAKQHLAAFKQRYNGFYLYFFMYKYCSKNTHKHHIPYVVCRRFPEVSEFKDRVHRDCSTSDMTVRTILGRQRFVDNLFTQAVNSVIQVCVRCLRVPHIIYSTSMSLSLSFFHNLILSINIYPNICFH